MGQPCQGSDGICKGAISGHLNYITRVGISGFVAASCCFSISPMPIIPIAVISHSRSESGKPGWPLTLSRCPKQDCEEVYDGR